LQKVENTTDTQKHKLSKTREKIEKNYWFGQGANPVCTRLTNHPGNTGREVHLKLHVSSLHKRQLQSNARCFIIVDETIAIVRQTQAPRCSCLQNAESAVERVTEQFKGHFVANISGFDARRDVFYEPLIVT